MAVRVEQDTQCGMDAVRRGHPRMGAPPSAKLTREETAALASEWSSRLPMEIQRGLRHPPPFALNHTVFVRAVGADGQPAGELACRAARHAFAVVLSDVTVRGRPARCSVEQSPARRQLYTSFHRATGRSICMPNRPGWSAAKRRPSAQIGHGSSPLVPKLGFRRAQVESVLRRRGHRLRRRRWGRSAPEVKPLRKIQG